MAPSSFELILFGFILLLPFLYETSRTFRYYFKFIVFYGIVTFIATIFIPIFLLRPRSLKNLVLSSYFCNYISCLLGLRWELRGKEHLNQDVACIIIANHQSSLDLLGMFHLWPIMNRCTAVAKKELFYAWPFGLAAWLSGLIFIDRLNSEKARSVINTASKQSKDEKFKLWIFPEGTRRNTGEIHPFKKGAFYAAINAQLPILPVVFSSYYFLSNKEKRFDSGHIVITTLPLISTKGLNKDDVVSLMEKTRNVMSEVFHATSTEVQLALPSDKPYIE
ncbi:1-acyl-sn-glycerol-3-phosphate acyltransferase alpha [Polistes fuscatus]|uniref:1-acyl-sn-glycerol-3-phosphate acyltransferase alpha n=1 Tax=Polistes fuscatus TaxID=30207 RepID=UPI001CA9B3CC|nr:1-acyl-sn-glycerol-3-phosphate acyltransferase alpha [Polistes fuscatus]